MLSVLLPQTVGIGVPVLFASLHFLSTGDKLDLVHALLGISLAVLLTGIITGLIKVSVGRWLFLSGAVCGALRFPSIAGRDRTFITVVSQMVRCRLTWCVWERERWWRKEGRAFPAATLLVSQKKIEKK